MTVDSRSGMTGPGGPAGADPLRTNQPEPPLSERRAVQRCLAGEVEAFEPLVRAHAQRIIRLSYHFLGDWDDARDLAQEALARAFHCLPQYDPQRPFGTWLCTIAARLATDRIRRRTVAKKAESFLRSRPSRAFDPDMALSLREALSRLTPRQRQAVVLCDLHGFSAPEAAVMIGCSASTIRVQRFLARGRMRALLGAFDGMTPSELTPATVPEEGD